MRPRTLSKTSSLQRSLGITLSIFLLVGLQACGGDAPGWNVVLISIDTLRPDHLGCYGYERDTSPNLDALCRESVVFREPIAHAPSTLPSHASILTSLIPAHHGASFADKTPLPQEIVTLAEVLQEEGYRTASFNGGGQIDPVWGLDQGFEIYEAKKGDDFFMEIVGSGEGWLRKIRKQTPEAPFFLFLHTYEVHHPYSPSTEDLRRFADPPTSDRFGSAVDVQELKRLNHGPRPIEEGVAEFIRASYDAEIRSMDRGLGRLMEVLEQLGVDEKTLIVFTSDHGEEFGEHGWYGWHSHTLYDELLRVPLVIRFPEAQYAGKRVRRPVRSLDIGPTVLEVLGVPTPGQFSGVSLLEVMEGDVEDRQFAVSQRDVPSRGSPVASIRTHRWKYYNGFLYNLIEDPGETYDVSSNHWEVVRGLKARLEQALEGRKPPEADPVDLDQETRERLEALGYL